MSIVGLVWGLTCGFGTLVSAGVGKNGKLNDPGSLAFLAAHAGQVLSLVMALLGGAAIRRARSPGLAWAGVFAALAQALFLMAGLALLGSAQSDLGQVLGCISLMVTAAVFFGGCYGASVMSRPATRSLFVVPPGAGREDD
jgi:hypothetical protein